ncbi:hypothetical protein [Scytonema millei]|uniref:Uncharacterized protein n=1 Tax=Scytonema millei VB511283 TaxID=1245923 RepID=A0A9X5E2P6_9CYAN|nr:hypothetical protein [Scytonema millei]NHC34056.1 hypothetical protein [Scytonema millei VB511283]
MTSEEWRVGCGVTVTPDQLVILSLPSSSAPDRSLHPLSPLSSLSPSALLSPLSPPHSYFC